MGTTFGLSQADMARHLDNKQTVLCLVWDHVTDTQIAYKAHVGQMKISYWLSIYRMLSLNSVLLTFSVGKSC